MKLNKENYTKVKEAIVDSLNRFLKFVDEYCSEYAWVYNNYEKYNEKSKGRLYEWAEENNVILDKLYKDFKYYQYKHIAEDLLEHIDEVHAKVIEVFIDIDEKVYPNKTLELLYQFRFFCYGDNCKGNFLSLKEQNERLKEYPHFDISMKRNLKCLGDFK